MAFAPPPASLTLGVALTLRETDVLTLTASVASTVVLFARGRDGTNGQPVTVGASSSLPIRGSAVGSVLLTSGAVTYVFGQHEVPSLPGGTEVPVKVVSPNPLPVTVSNPPTNPAPIGVLYSGSNVPFSGNWTGYALATAAGEVAISTYGGKVVLGTATAAGQAFAFKLSVEVGNNPGLTNCTIAGGWLSQA